MKKVTTLTAVALAMLLTTGCSKKSKYEAYLEEESECNLHMLRSSYEKEVIALQMQLDMDEEEYKEFKQEMKDKRMKMREEYDEKAKDIREKYVEQLRELREELAEKKKESKE